MLVINCPNCGPRNDSEFIYQGETVPRPAGEVDPSAWRRYLYFRSNPLAWQQERWFHVSGCRRFLTVERHTLTNEIRSVSEIMGGSR